MREVRFSLGPDGHSHLTNSYAGWPAAVDVHPYLVLQAVLSGKPDPRTGYLVNIAVIDRIMRERAIPLIREMCASRDCAPGHLMLALAEALEPCAPAGTTWSAWNLKITPYLTYSIEPGATHMLLTQTFEFAAAHRLHSDEMTDDENRAYFGKCNNPSGHGHNYVLEVSIAGRRDNGGYKLLGLPQLERTVKEQVIDRFDHKHLNLDCPEFGNLNPSVENIARVIWGLLEHRMAPASLARVRVWETSKTYAEYAGEDE